MTDTVYWIWLQLVFGVGSRRSALMLDYFDSPLEIYEGVSPHGKFNGMLMPEERERVPTALDMAENIRSRTIKKGCEIITPDMDGYPLLLREIYPRPAALYVKGDLSCLKGAPAIAVVGSRDTSEYGIEVTKMLAGDLAKNGAVIVSGLARGIDSAAHWAALDAGGKTVGFLGCGIDVDYPYGSAALKRAVSENGAVVTEFPLGFTPMAYNFPVRNRLVSGISHGTLVTEAAIGSGALITADLALEQGRDVFAVPGSILDHRSAGKHKLISDGAKIASCAEDILAEYPMFAHPGKTEYNITIDMPIIEKEQKPKPEPKPEPKPAPKTKPKPEPKTKQKKKQKQESEIPARKDLPGDISADAEKVYAFIGTEPAGADVLAASAGLETAGALAALTELEIYGLIQMHPGRLFGLA